VRTLVGDLPPLEGYVSAAPMVRVAYLEQAQSELAGDATVLETLRGASGLEDQDARDLLARFLFRGDEVDRKVGVLSGGERARLALARLAVREANLLVLDEPTNHLDLAAREQLERVLADFAGTLLFVSHDRYFIDKLASELWLIDDGTLRRFEGNWSRYQRERAAGRDATLVPYESIAIAPQPPARAARPSPAPKPPAERADPKTRPGAVRRVTGLRALESRIEAMELQLRQLTEKVALIAQSGNYMETRRVGEEHAALERSLRELYDEWTKAQEEQA